MQETYSVIYYSADDFYGFRNMYFQINERRKASNFAKLMSKRLDNVKHYPSHIYKNKWYYNPDGSFHSVESTLVATYIDGYKKR